MICEEEVKKWLNVLEKSPTEIHTREKDQRLFDSLDDLISCLNELKEYIEKKGNLRAILQEIPSAGKLLGKLAQNCIVQCSENAVKILFQCIICLASAAGSTADSATHKTIAWAQSQLRHMVSPSPSCPSSVLLIGQFIGYTATEATQTMTWKVVNSICFDLIKHNGTKWSHLANDMVPTLTHQGISLRTLSDMCVPLVFQPVAKPLVETLLVVGNTSSDLLPSSKDQVVDCLSPRFFACVTEFTRQKKLNLKNEDCGVQHTLSYQSLVSLWRRYQPSFESQIFDLVEGVTLGYPEASCSDIKRVIQVSRFARAFRDFEELFLAAIQILYSFVRNSPQNERLTQLLGLFEESIVDYYQ